MTFPREPTLTTMIRRATILGTRGYIKRAIDTESRAWHNPATAWPSSSGGSISPRALVAHLDSFVVGQERAKKVLAVA